MVVLISNGKRAPIETHELRVQGSISLDESLLMRL